MAEKKAFVGTDLFGNLRNMVSGRGGGLQSGLRRWLVPALAVSGLAYTGYQAIANGSKDKSLYANVKNVLGRALDKYLRNTKPTPATNVDAYVTPANWWLSARK